MKTVQAETSTGATIESLSVSGGSLQGDGYQYTRERLSSIPENDLADLVIERMLEDRRCSDSESVRIHSDTVQEGAISGAKVSLPIPRLHLPDVGNYSNIENTGSTEGETARVDEACALVDMGFSSTEALKVLQKVSTIEEAANALLDKDHPTKTPWETLIGCLTWGRSCSQTASYPPGTYRIVSREGALAKQDIQPCIGQPDQPPNCFEEGSLVEIVEVQVNRMQQLVRGRMLDGHWINIASADDDWAELIPFETQLIECGLSADEAREAAKRCSTAGAALDYRRAETGPAACSMAETTALVDS